MRFYLECVREAAADGIEVARRLVALLGRDRERLTSYRQVTVASIRLFDALPEHPVVIVPGVSSMLDITAPTARKAIEVLVALDILRETSGKRRARVFAYHNYLQILTAE